MIEPLAHSHCQRLELHHPNYQSRAELCFTLATLAELQRQVLDFLHPEELEFWTSLAFEKRQQSYLLGRHTAKLAISRYDTKVTCSGILIKPGVFEYPIAYYPSNQRIQTTISHCECLGAALAFPESCPMGIDVESIRPNHTATIETQLTDNEKRLISSYPYLTDITSNTLCTIFWTIKEALSKVLRTGMMTPFEIYAVKNIIPRGNYWVSEFENFGQYQAISFLLGEQICSIVYPKNTQLIINIPEIQNWFLNLYPEYNYQ